MRAGVAAGASFTGSRPLALSLVLRPSRYNLSMSFFRSASWSSFRCAERMDSFCRAAARAAAASAAAVVAAMLLALSIAAVDCAVVAIVVGLPGAALSR